MGVPDTRKPPLPAPTDASWAENGSVVAPTDLATDISRRTDRTSYSIPEDGSPLTISTHKLLGETSVGGASQPSLLIEYFEDRGKSGAKSSTRPSVRVRVTPHGKKKNDAVKITEMGSDRKPSYTRRISLGGRGESRIVDNADAVHSSESNLSSRGPPIEVEVLNNSSDLSTEAGSRTRFVPPTSDISSMPPDSLLEEEANRRRSRSVENSREGRSDTLKTPSRRLSRSPSRERIAQRVVEKLKDKDDLRDTTARRKSRKSRDRTSKDVSEESLDNHGRRTSSSIKEDDFRSGTDSSLLRSKDQYSSISGTTKSSITNPRLLQTVEDAIRRLILPEIETIKRQQSIHNDSRYVRRDRDSLASDLTDSRVESGHRLNKSSSAPKVLLTRDSNDPGTLLSGDSPTRHRRDSGSKESRRDSQSTNSRDVERERRAKLRTDRGTREAAAASTAAAGLTAAALRTHNSQSSLEREKRERRKQRSKSTSRTESSLTNTEDGSYISKEPVPPMPMRSDMQDSDLTRDSILSAETAGSDETPVIKDVRSPIKESSRASPRVPAETLSSNRSPSVASSRSARSARAAAGLAGAAGALYGLDRKKSSERRSLEPISPNRDNRELDRDMTPRPKTRDTAFTQRETLEPTQRPETALPLARQEEIRRSLVLDKPMQASPDGYFPPVRQEAQSKEFTKGVNADDESPDVFYDNQHELNDRYRSDVSYDDRSPEERHSDLSERADPFSNQATYGPSNQQLNNRSGLRPEVRHTPLGPESVVASIFGTSTVASTDPRSRSMHARTYSNATNERSGDDNPTRPPVEHDVFEHDNPSMERWAAIRNHARTLSDESGKDGDARGLIHSGIDAALTPSADTQREASGARNLPTTQNNHGAAAKSPVSDGTQDSTIRNPLRNEQQPSGKRGNQLSNQPQMDRPYDVPNYSTVRNSPLHPNQSEKQFTPHPPASKRSPEVFEQNLPQYEVPRQNQGRNTRANRGFSLDKDEGYVSGPPAQSAGSVTPLSFSKEPPRLFGSNGPEKYDPIMAGDPFISGNNRLSRQISDDSRAYSSPGRDGTPGNGVSDIQSRDVVALMDHLTVRDGQRSARDTEILVTLVRSASEMRNFQDEIKKFIEHQNKINMERNDMNIEKTLKTLGGPRPQPFSPRDRNYSGEQEESSGKKQNIFKRALKGLNSKNPNDLDKIEDMFMQILDEMEELREHSGMNRLPSGQPHQHHQGSDSYERQRAASYDQEEGHTQHDSRNHGESGRFNGVERDSYDDGQGGVDIGGRDLTPTQERYNGGVRFADEDEEIKSPSKNTDKQNKHKSAGSSIFSGFPKMSRWSKTTTSSAATEDQNNDRPYSQHSQSGSQVDILPTEDNYMQDDDDRLRSVESMNRNNQRAQSPAVPEHVKYQAQSTQPMLLHPQPRQGSTDRHHTQLESQANVYDDMDSAPSPDSDAFGSVPNLARFHGSGIAGPRTGNPAQTLQHAGNNVSPNGQRQMQNPPNAARSFEQQQQIPTESATAYAVHNPSSSIPTHLHHPTASQSSTVSTATTSSTSSSATSPGHPEHPSAFGPQQAWIDPIPLSRKRSPYSPGGLLAPIEERYSMEQAEHGEWAQKHLPLLQQQQRHLPPRADEPGDRRPSYAETASSVASARSARSSGLRNEVLREEDDEDENDGQQRTPRASPRPAVRGAVSSASPASTASPLARKITGPREMPGVASGSAGGGAAVPAFEESRVIMGTRRRKPVPDGRR